MKLFEQFFENNSTRYLDCSEPESLPGVKKKSFVLPFRGGEIRFENLDVMYPNNGLRHCHKRHTFCLRKR